MATGLRALRAKRVVVLPDLYIDALAFLPPWDDTGPRLAAIAGRGGGNLPIGPVQMKLGGNAANLALGLARLGAQVDLVAETDNLGLCLLERASRGTRLSTRLVRVGETSSVTLGLECGGANVMLSHAGPLVDFGAKRLTDDDWSAIESADAVAVVNWAQNRMGTQLIKAVGRRLRGSETFLFVDTADPSHRLTDLPNLLLDPMWRDVDALGLNENELALFAGEKSIEPVAAAQRLAKRLGTRLDLHTRAWAATVTHDTSVRVKAQTGTPRRITGAGDAWNAGNLSGHMLGLSEKERLGLAHEVATGYVTGRNGLPPTAQELQASSRRRR